MTVAAATIRGGADGSDATKTGPVDKQASINSAKPSRGLKEEDGAYLRRKVRLLEREVSRLRETVERLTKERAERAAEGPKNDSKGQSGTITSTRGTKGNAPGAPTGAIMGSLPPPPHTPA